MLAVVLADTATGAGAEAEAVASLVASATDTSVGLGAAEGRSLATAGLTPAGRAASTWPASLD